MYISCGFQVYDDICSSLHISRYFFSAQRNPFLHHFALTNYLLERSRYLAVRTPLLQDFFRPVTSVFHLLCKSTRSQKARVCPVQSQLLGRGTTSFFILLAPFLRSQHWPASGTAA